MELIDELSARHTYAQIADLLNERECLTGAGDEFGKESVRWICQTKGLKCYRERQRAKGMMTPGEMADRFDISLSRVKHWRNKGGFPAMKCNDKGDWLYFPPDNGHESLSECVKRNIMSKQNNQILEV